MLISLFSISLLSLSLFFQPHRKGIKRHEAIVIRYGHLLALLMPSSSASAGVTQSAEGSPSATDEAANAQLWLIRARERQTGFAGC
ncbi:hypothetical protein LI328DRAFT_5902 [Trichoderma asperelloides]|nr:hypothetical protein LI328DRAFT_5902 [Trichoderma asperelloides]